MAGAQHLFDLPNEILVSIFSLLRTAELLPLTVVSQHFHYVALRILHLRLLLAASNPLYKIILEAYIPSRRYTRPYLYCTYLGTDGLSSSIGGQGSLYADCKDDSGNESFRGRLAKLGGLYSRFRPEYPGVKGQRPVRRVAGAAPNPQSNTDALQTDWFNAPGNETSQDSNVTLQTQATSSSSHGPAQQGEAAAEPEIQLDVASTSQDQVPQSQPIWSDFGDGGAKKVVYTLHFDEHELFGQFCAVASLVRLGPYRGVFQSYMPLCTDRQGVIRIWREWLLRRSEAHAEVEREDGHAKPKGLNRTPTSSKLEDVDKDKSILWIDHKKNIGLKLLVKEISLPDVEARGPDEDKDDIPLLFEVEIQEFIIRTPHLMLAVEDSEQAQERSNNALIFGNFSVGSE